MDSKQNVEVKDAACWSRRYQSVDFKQSKINCNSHSNKSDFISYINSLHNINADGSNALAESQALSPYFGELYVPFPLSSRLSEALIKSAPRVVILTGHAGDGKSTIALDIYKKLKGLDQHKPLNTALKEREDLSLPQGPVSIVKDMSELSAEIRQQWLGQALKSSGSWLIISNTGPLLDSLQTYAKNELGHQELDVQNAVLKALDQPLDDRFMEQCKLEGFEKDVLILNLTRWDNLSLVDSLLERLLEHSGWQECGNCELQEACPLYLNREALRSAGASARQRVRWVYQRMTAYEQRLTLRQIVAHLAFSLTGGMTCEQARESIVRSGANGIDRATSTLQEMVFSESFFGFRAGKEHAQSGQLKAIKLLRRMDFGVPVGVEFERQLIRESGGGWGILPNSLLALEQNWRRQAVDSSMVRWRAALRRMLYVFASPRKGCGDQAEKYQDAFLGSNSLREIDDWQKNKKITLSDASLRRLRDACLRVLLEAYSGFSAGQFRESDTQQLYLTLQRSDSDIVQPTQIVIETLQFRDFRIIYDSEIHLPKLVFRSGSVFLPLSLPLIDYIRARDAGELGSALSPMHRGKLEFFRSQLLSVTDYSHEVDGEITLLRSSVNGEVRIYRIEIDKERQVLETFEQ